MSIADTAVHWQRMGEVGPVISGQRVRGAVMFDMETLLTIRKTFNHAIVAGDEKFKMCLSVFQSVSV
jgi:hypothetical protein